MSDDPYEKRAEASRREYHEDRISNKELNEQREQYLAQVQGEGADEAASAPTDRTDTARESLRHPEIGNVIYAWQMRVQDGWNIIGMMTPGGTLPLVTTSMPMAWEAFEVAQAHANRAGAQVRLAAFAFDTLAAVVDPNDG